MSNCILQATTAPRIGRTIDELLASGGRMQMAYAWFPESGAPAELRYIATVRGQRAFAVWHMKSDAANVPSMAGKSPLLGWYEREMMEMSGVEFSGHPQPERLVTAHMAQTAQPPLVPVADAHVHEHATSRTLAMPSLPQVSGKHVQLLPFGPVRADVVESAQFIFYYIGEGILHYHPNLFLKHRGMEKQFESTDPMAGVLTAERVSGVGSVAHALAFSQAVEDAAGCEVPERARWIRVIVAELERVYNHLHYLGHLCHTTTLKVGEAEGKLLEERAKQMNARATGSRFLRNVICPGGARRDIDMLAIAEGLDGMRSEIDRYIGLIERTTSHIDRLISTAPLSQQLAFDQGASGPVERASGVDRDLRRDHPYAAYDVLQPVVATHAQGDAFARMKVRIAELRASIQLLDAAVMHGMDGGLLVAPYTLPPHSEGLGWSESPRGTVLYALHFDVNGRIARAKIKSASFSNWNAFQFTVNDSNMMDYAINEASFGLTIAGCAR
ncbi:nickel-dependent hydrogenase large subunit [Paraburkholderia sp. C35]|uniref:NADH-quinone oxidoreductase subunit D-related protein n=1 Tax=Paraburkholderia sp. C35 TaxID=2126993 RepID=UPI0019505F37|nr:nickel-dependent hydrogenase large subunit [Paraburkholderia sp. C35]